MTEENYQIFKNNPLINGQPDVVGKIEYQETHISYLLMLPKHVYKIKKSVKLPFLDFSTLVRRKKVCMLELELNKRTAPEIYLDVQQIKKEHADICIGGEGGKTIDYAVRMKRMDNRKEMDQMIIHNEVTHEHMKELADVIVHFHQEAPIVNKKWNLSLLQETYNQLQAQSRKANALLGKQYEQIINDSCLISNQFLESKITYLNQRSQKTLVRDVHGDLHSRNIFLLNPPVIFDCIEFDEDLRQIDLLNEIAFLIMDMEFYGADELAKYFYQHYINAMQAAGLSSLEDDDLLIYFKMYRASVRAKVSFISVDKIQVDEERKHKIHEIKRYLELVKRYAVLLT